MITIKIAERAGASMLRGRGAGRGHYPRLCESLSRAQAGSVCLLDFDGVEVVSAAWADECLVPLMRWAADGRNDVFPMLANVHRDCVDDLRLVACWTHTCFLLDKGKRPAAMLGRLDEGQRATLSAVLDGAGGVTGASLAGRGDVKATAWNNRLADLHRKRLIRREKRGREQVYRPVVAIAPCE